MHKLFSQEDLKGVDICRELEVILYSYGVECEENPTFSRCGPVTGCLCVR